MTFFIEPELVDGRSVSDVHREIGHFIYEFSRLEDWLRMTLSVLVKLTDKQFDAVMPALDFTYLCKACLAAAKEGKVKPGNAEAIETVLKRCLKLNDERVRVAHGTWYAGAAYHTSRGSLQSGEYFANPGELDKMADELVELRHELQNLIAK